MRAPCLTIKSPPKQNRLGWGTLTIIAWATRPLEEHADRRPAPRTTAQKRTPTTPRIYNLSGRPAVAAVT